eukprot:gnl/MRDRNA2_/MRDRNA2_67849_c0_seq1.p1 gnl/MRDRNA2_/MRDRNA2_67849_c0~~gnl/MRDRNA2_/MRDRNA2_67849_c0_seq1.p1  ORF type:complete len:217 (+),score=35.02 gnl/MRDRNA2_/MRDRNA2_67849_c0_seq1:173-823(+)
MAVDGRIWIGGLPADATGEELGRVFSKFGRIQSIRIRNSTRDTYAFLQFFDIHCAGEALKSMDGSNAFGTSVTVRWADKDPTKRAEQSEGSSGSNIRQTSFNRRRTTEQMEPMKDSRSDGERSRSPARRAPLRRKITIEYLPDDMSWHELKRHVQDYGVKVTYVKMYRKDGIHCGVLEFDNQEDCTKIWQQFDGRRFQGSDRRLRVTEGGNDSRPS